MLDTALFRGEGEVFEPMHRTIAEFLAGKSLAKAVVGTGGRAAFPLSRAATLIAGADGLPPTELRGLYAWFTARLAKLGDTAGVMRLIEIDAVTVLIYGDAAVFDTTARRSLLVNLDRNDPYFRASEIEVAAVGGLAGEDLADDFTAALTGPSDGTHRLLTVLEALTGGPPVLSLRPLLRAFALDAARPEWMRRRAMEAYLNGANDPAIARRELFDALAGKPISLAREALRAQQAALLPTGALKVADVKSVLADFRRLPEDNMVGRLSALQRRLENDPLPELFDNSTGGWLITTSDRRHKIEVDHLLDYALAGAIKGTPDLSAAQLWRWTVNVRDHATSTLKDQTAKALAAWLNVDEGREVALFNAMLAEDDPTSGPWLVTNRYIWTTRWHPSAAIIRHALAKARVSSTHREKKRLFSIAVDIARRPAADIEAYWEAHDCIAREAGCKVLLRQLTVTTIEKWRLQDYARTRKERQREAKQKAQLVRTMAPALAAMKSAGGPIISAGRRASTLRVMIAIAGSPQVFSE